MRLDNYLVKNNLVFSRNKATELIKNKKVKVNGKTVTKPSFKIDQKDNIKIDNETIYVSRASYKLKGFLNELQSNNININIENNNILDIGSSTGGFTQVLLEYNPQTISCVDVGSNQLHELIKNNKKIFSYENCDIRNFKNKFNIDTFNLITCDVSFISLNKILTSIDKLASKYIILLFKPQFEVGIKAKRDNNGKVLDIQSIENAKMKFLQNTKKLNWKLIYNSKSSITGKSGNLEELFLFEKITNNITSIAIGGFDGLHLAHQQLLSNLDENGAIVVIESGYSNLTPNRYRENFTNLPIYYYNLSEIKHLNADEFLNILNNKFPKLKLIVVGYDFAFGANRAYKAKDLLTMFKGKTKIIDEIKLNNISIHSKAIRKFISNSKIELANQLLGRNYQIMGTHILGQGIGTKEFVPTINIKVENFLLPDNGVYITQTIINNITYNSVSFIGNRETTDQHFAIETHLLNTDININTNQKIKIEFIKKLRNNYKFDNFSALKQQITKDIKISKDYFATNINKY